jgi:hypothetical protein
MPDFEWKGRGGKAGGGGATSVYPKKPTPAWLWLLLLWAMTD